MTGALADADIERMTRMGMPPLPVDEALALFDTALAAEEPAVLPMRLDFAPLRDGVRSRRCCAA